MKNNKLLKRLAAIGLLNAADYILTFYALKRGHEELNPVMAHIVHTPLFPILKLAIVRCCLQSFGTYAKSQTQNLGIHHRAPAYYIRHPHTLLRNSIHHRSPLKLARQSYKQQN